MNASEMKQRVLAGAARLDERSPGWALKVSPDRLNLARRRAGVLEHVFGGYNAGLAALGLTSGAELGFDLPGADCPELGLTVPDDIRAAYAALTALWVEQVVFRTFETEVSPR